jgi:hypothetical protein
MYDHHTCMIKAGGCEASGGGERAGYRYPQSDHALLSSPSPLSQSLSTLLPHHSNAPAGTPPTAKKKTKKTPSQIRATNLKKKLTSAKTCRVKSEVRRLDPVVWPTPHTPPFPFLSPLLLSPSVRPPIVSVSVQVFRGVPHLHATCFLHVVKTLERRCRTQSHHLCG